MNDLLSKIYDKVVCYERDSIQFGKEYDCRAYARKGKPLQGRILILGKADRISTTEYR